MSSLDEEIAIGSLIELTTEVGVEYDAGLDAVHQTYTETPSDIDKTWFYWVMYYYKVEKLLKRDIVLKLEGRYPWYKNQGRNRKTKAIELTRLLRGVDNGSNPRLQRVIVKVNDNTIIAGLKELESMQRARALPIKQGEWETIMKTPINRDTFKRRLGKIIEKKHKSNKPKNRLEARDLIKSVETIHGPWQIPEWQWFNREESEENENHVDLIAHVISE
jgi:hypothetical protein